VDDRSGASRCFVPHGSAPNHGAALATTGSGDLGSVTGATFLGLLFLLQTKFRPQLQEDVYYSVWLASQAKVFENFAPENLPAGKTGPSLEESSDLSVNPKLSGADDLDQTRVGRYEKYHGIFLVHSWRPSRQPGQAADIVLLLQQHGDGPLKAGRVDYVEYSLGPKFFLGTVIKRNREECFRLEVSAYAPMLCVARVHLTDGSSFDLERHADFAWDVAFRSCKVAACECP
jgi:hypothetical protein